MEGNAALRLLCWLKFTSPRPSNECFFFLSDIIHKMNFPLFTFSLFSRRGQVAERGTDMTAEYGLDLRIYQIDQGESFFFFHFLIFQYFV